MLPEIGGIPLYRPVLVLSVVLQLGLLLWLVRREGIRIRTLVPYLALLGLGGILGAKAASVAFHGGPRGAEIELTGGLRYPGALLGVLGLGFFLRRMLPASLSFARFADLWAPSFALACAIGRLGCLVTGCCYGTLCTGPFCIAYPRGSIPWWQHFDDGLLPASAPASLPVHPFPLYLLAMELGVLALCLWALRRRQYGGQVMLLFLAVHGLLKGAIELTRHPYSHFHQLVLPVALVAAILLLVRWYQTRQGVGAAAAI
jgi:phosphatidylglycerol:prolipoprotein diacylglycerol transferase